MPIIEPTRHSAPVFFPNSDYTIVKYFDLTKFVSLLYKQALFFCRLDKLEDKFEGTSPKANFDFRVKWYRQASNFSSPMTDEEIFRKIQDQVLFEKKLKALNCVNCWNKKEQESAALWKIYSNFSKGIMIKSSISRLKKSLEAAPEQLQLSEIEYKDYNKEPIPDGNAMFPLIHKQKAYSYEDEIRLIFEKLPEVGWDYDWAQEEVEEGLYISTNLNELIEEIIIGPYSPKWFFKLVEDIAKKYNIEKPINKSELTPD